jgi:hypothetical protein
MVLARKSSSKSGKSVPQDWSEGVAVLLNDTYKTECTKEGRYFDVYGQIFPEELLVIVSYLSEKDPAVAPIACFLSCDTEQMKTETMVKETQSNFMDVAGLFFDEIFSSDDWSDFEPVWQEVKYKTHTYHYKLTRENINLTIEANRLLGDGFDEDI